MKNILVIFGGDSSEHDISVITGVHTLNAMPAKGYRAIPLYLRDGVFYTGGALFDINAYIDFSEKSVSRAVLNGKELFVFKRNKLKKSLDIDGALLATHGGAGENGALQGFLEINGIPFSSSGVLESAICMNKIVTKTLLNEMGINTVEGKGFNYPFHESDITYIEDTLKYPVVIKPCSQGSSIGVAFVKDREELLSAVEVASAFDAKILVEKAVENFTEINSAVALINGEIVLSELEKPVSLSKVLSYQDKYMSGGMGSGEREFPAKIENGIREKILKTTKRVYEELNLFGAVRMDYFVAEGKIYLNEINTIPGSLAHYLFPDYAHSEFLKRIINSAIARGIQKAPAFKTGVLENYKKSKGIEKGAKSPLR
ncbi:MAG: ATP-grasp domain-containing protein [Firmicutes bacterium]|nr:ATP-grasp domain-containing protein [Bacillota bacterium]